MAESSTEKSELVVRKRWYASRFLHCALLFAVVTGIFTASATKLLPAEAVNHPAGWKFAQFQASPQKPDILMLGSSLTLIPAVRADSVARGDKTRIDEEACFQSLNYNKAQYLEKKLDELGMTHAQVLNMSIIAAMSSDYLMMLENLLKENCKPDLIVCSVAPRDFVCLAHGANFVSATYVRNQLAYIEKTFPELQFGKQFGGASPVFNMIAEEHFELLNGWQAMKACATSKTLSVLATVVQKSPLRDRFDQSLLKTWSHEPLTYDYLPCYGPRTNVLGDIDQYKGYYKPVNWSGYAVQKDAYDRLLALAASENIPVVVVSMPLTDANLALLDQPLLEAYRHDVREIAQKHHAAFYNLQKSSRFAFSDFEDSAHLNEFGGKKFFDFLAQEVSGLRQGGASFVAATNASNKLPQ